jgi:hypothetical protein
MSESPALTANELAALDGVSTLLRYLSPVPDVDIATALINQATFTYPLAQLTVDSTSADWLEVREGDTVFIGTSAGLSDVGIYRARLDTNSTTIFLGETSSQDVGLLPVAIRTASFANNQYVTVKRRFDIWSILPVINSSTGAIYEDWNRTVGTNNTTPAPLVNIACNGRRNHISTLIPAGETFSFSGIATPTSWSTSSGETFTYAWTTPASGWSSISGSTTSTLTAEVEPGNYVLYLTVTGSLSGATERVIVVNIHDSDVNPPVIISEMPRSDVRTRVGRRIQFDLYDDKLTAIPDGAMCLYFEMPTWANRYVDSTTDLNEALDTTETGVDVVSGAAFSANDIILIEAEQMFVVSISTNTLTVTRGYNGTTAAAHVTGLNVYVYRPATDVPTATRQMAGWFTRQDKSTSDGLRQTSLELISPSFLLDMLNSTSQIVSVVASPATWQQVVSGISTVSFMVWYMLRWRVANILRLFNYTPLSVTAAGQRLPGWTIDRGTILQQLQLLVSQRCNFGCDSEGEFYLRYHPNLMSYPRSGVVVRDVLNASRYTTTSNPRELQNRVQQVRGEGFSWDGSAALPTPGYSDAPKVQGQGTAQTKIPSLVVTDQDELEQITGDRYAQENNPYPANIWKIQRNRDVIEPAQMQFVQLNIPDYLSSTNAAWQSNVVPISITKTHNADGTADIDGVGEGETHNLTGDFVPVPVGNDSLYTPPFTPLSIDPLPLPSLGDFYSVTVPDSVPGPAGSGGQVEPTVSPGKGAIAVSADGTKILRTYDVTIEPPTWDDVTPSTFFTAFVQVVHDKSSNFSRGAYALGNDGTDSKIAYTTDVYATTPVWTNGDTLTGIYTAIESAGRSSLAGGAIAYSPSNSTQHYSTSPLASVDLPGNDTTIAITSGDIITITVPSSDTWCYGPGGGQCPNADGNGSELAPAGAMIVGNPLGQLVARVGTSGSWTAIGTSGGFTAGATGNLYLICNDVTGAFTDNSGSLTVSVTISSASATASSATTSDYGATVSEQTVGTSPGSTGAFALSRYGTVNLAAVDTKLRIATTFGGAYSDEADGGTSGTYPIAARIPWWRLGSSSKTNNSSSPDYVLASAAAISTESLWKIALGVKTAITPSVSGTKAVGVSSFCIGTWMGKQIVFLGSVSGTIYAFTTKNTGTSWTHVAIAGANSVRAQRFDSTGKKWIIGTATGVKLSLDGGTTWLSRTLADGALFIELMG